MFRTFTQTTTTEAVFSYGSTKQDFAAYPMNVQVSCANLGDATFDVLIFLPGESDYKTHVAGATSIDTVMIAGKDAPLFEMVKVVLNGASASVNVVLTCWERGI